MAADVVLELSKPASRVFCDGGLFEVLGIDANEVNAGVNVSGAAPDVVLEFSKPLT